MQWDDYLDVIAVRGDRLVCGIAIILAVHCDVANRSPI